MGLWSDIVRRGTTGQCRKEDDFPLVVIRSLNNSSGMASISVGICTTYKGKTDEICIHYSTGINFRNMQAGCLIANNYHKSWQIRPATHEQKEKWLKVLEEYQHITPEDVMNIVRFQSEGEKILTYL